MLNSSYSYFNISSRFSISLNGFLLGAYTFISASRSFRLFGSFIAWFSIISTEIGWVALFDTYFSGVLWSAIIFFSGTYIPKSLYWNSSIKHEYGTRLLNIWKFIYIFRLAPLCIKFFFLYSLTNFKISYPNIESLDMLWISCIINIILSSPSFL